MSNLDKPVHPIDTDWAEGWSATGQAPPPAVVGLTKREHAAILMRVPDSGDPEIDEMIRAARRQDIATAVMQAVATNTPSRPAFYAEVATACADALVELEKHG